jgi:ribosomal protein S18 acetylase RimI-like enzyme
MPTTIVRRAAPADLPALVERWRGLVAHHARLGDPLWQPAPHAEETYLAFLRHQLTLRRSLVLLAETRVRSAPGRPGRTEVEGYLVGALGQRAPVWAIRELGMVFDLVVRPEARRTGVGTQLLEAAAEFFRSHGAEYVQVNYAQDNVEAVGFWSSRGFRPLLVEAYRSSTP